MTKRKGTEPTPRPAAFANPVWRQLAPDVYASLCKIAQGKA